MELTDLLREKDMDMENCELQLGESRATIADMKESMRASALRNKQMLVDIEIAIANDIQSQKPVRPEVSS